VGVTPAARADRVEATTRGGIHSAPPPSLDSPGPRIPRDRAVIILSAVTASKETVPTAPAVIAAIRVAAGRATAAIVRTAGRASHAATARAL